LELISGPLNDFFYILKHSPQKYLVIVFIRGSSCDL
jgi:hypothetical protein